MRTTLMFAVLVAVAAVIAAPAGAKEGVRAKLDSPVRMGTAPGKTLRVSWRLADQQGRPFGAGGIYLRVSRCGASPLIVRASERSNGRYSARFNVPRGGIRKLLVGLQGWRMTPGHRERADRFFQFDPPLFRRCS